MVFGRLFRRDSAAGDIAATLYGAIVAQARQPALYARFGVPDTLDGRFEMVVLHTALVTGRLMQGAGAEKAAGQAVFDLYCLDMDRSLREIGIGDLGVPKRMKRMTERYYGRAGAYQTALANGDIAALRAAVERNVFNGPAAGAGLLTGYAVAFHRALAATSPAALLSAVPFVDPATVGEEVAA